MRGCHPFRWEGKKKAHSKPQKVQRLCWQILKESFSVYNYQTNQKVIRSLIKVWAKDQLTQLGFGLADDIGWNGYRYVRKTIYIKLYDFDSARSRELFFLALCMNAAHALLPINTTLRVRKDSVNHSSTTRRARTPVVAVVGAEAPE